MMTEPAAGERGMGAERLAEIERIDGYVWARPYMRGLSEEHRHELLAELTRLRAENERLREGLEEISEGIGCNSTYGPGCDRKCKDIAFGALNPTDDKARAGLEVE